MESILPNSWGGGSQSPKTIKLLSTIELDEKYNFANDRALYINGDHVVIDGVLSKGGDTSTWDLLIYNWKSGALSKAHMGYNLIEMSDSYYVIEKIKPGKHYEIYRFSDHAKVGEFDLHTSAKLSAVAWMIASDREHLLCLTQEEKHPKQNVIVKYKLSDGSMVKKTTLPINGAANGYTAFDFVSGDLLISHNTQNPKTSLYSLDKLLDNNNASIMEVNSSSTSSGSGHARYNMIAVGKKYLYLRFNPRAMRFDVNSFKNSPLTFRIRNDKIRSLFSAVGQASEEFDMPIIAKYLSKEDGEFIMRTGLMTHHTLENINVSGDPTTPDFPHSRTENMRNSQHLFYEADDGHLVGPMKIFETGAMHSAYSRLDIRGVFIATPSGLVASHTDILSQYLIEQMSPQQQLAGLYPAKTDTTSIYNLGAASKDIIASRQGYTSGGNVLTTRTVYIFSNPFK